MRSAELWVSGLLIALQAVLPRRVQVELLINTESASNPSPMSMAIIFG